MQIVDLPPIPEWLNNAIFLASLIIIIVAAIMLGILQLHQRAATTNQGAGYDVSNQVAWIVNYQYLILIVSAIVAFTAGAFIFPTTSDDHAKHMPITEDIERKTTTIRLDDEVVPQPTLDDKVIVKTPGPVDIDKNARTPSVEVESVSPPSPMNIVTIPEASTTRVVTPRTPKELIDIARTKTKRDAMRHKETWIRVEGTVLNISEVKRGVYNHLPNPYIKLEVRVGWIRKNIVPYRVHLHVDAAKWKPQVDKIGRGDWLVANGVVHDVRKYSMDVINGEISSISGPDGSRR